MFYFSKDRDSILCALSALPEPRPLMFKFQVLSPTGGPLVFKPRCYGDSFSPCGSPVPGVACAGASVSSLSVTMGPSLSRTASWVCFAPNHVSALLTLLLASSLHLLVESLSCHSLGCFLIYADVGVIYLYLWTR